MEVKLLILAGLLLGVAVSVPVKFRITDLVQESVDGPENDDFGLAGIYGGNEITIEEANYVGALVIKGNFSVVGTVTILNNNWAITAGHIFSKHHVKDLCIKVGSTVPSKDGHRVEIGKLYVHPQSDRSHWDKDIALIKFQTPLKFSQTVGCITIGKLPENGSNGLVTGYGKTKEDAGEYLKQVTVPINDWKTCNASITDYAISKYSFCSIVDESGPCTNDFGAPMFHEQKLVGVFSGNHACGTSKSPSVFSNLSMLRGWIRETMKL